VPLVLDQAFKGPLAHKDQEDPTEQQVQQVQVPQDYKAQEDPQAQQVQVQQDLQEAQDLQVDP
jgi:hypothetical protein